MHVVIVAFGIALVVALAVSEKRPELPAWLPVAMRGGIGFVMLWLLVAGLLMSGLGCDDTCGAEGPWWEHRDAWQWHAQLWLVIAAIGVWVLSRRWRAQRWSLTLATVLLIGGWTVLVLPVDNGPI